MANDCIQDAINHAETLQNDLTSGTVSEEACETVLADLVNLRGSVAPKNGEKGFIMSIDEMLKDFTQYAEISKSRLQGMLSLISDGKVPSQDSVSELDGLIGELRQKYASVYQAALSQLPESEMPSESASVNEIVDAVKNSKTLNIKRQLDVAADCLGRFLSVRSFVETYAKALSPYQNEAKAMLDGLKNAEALPEKLEERLEGPKAFIAALECEDKDSEEGILLCDKVDEYYPSLVGRGVAAGKFVFDEAYHPDEISVPVIEEQKTDDPVRQPNSHDDDNIKEKPSEIPGDTTKDSVSDYDNAEEASSEFVAALKNNDFFIVPDEFGDLCVEKSDGEGRKVSSSIFTNEIKQTNRSAVKTIIQHLDGDYCLTKQRLVENKGINEVIADATLAYLFRKGYLKKYILNRKHEFYCPSSRLKKALSQQDACRMVGVRHNSFQSQGDSIEDKASSASARVSMEKLIASSARRLSDRGVKKNMVSISLFTEAFHAKVFNDDNPSDSELLIGAFWTNPEEADAFYDEIIEDVLDCPDYSLVIISALDSIHAKTLADVIFSTILTEKDLPKTYLYSLADDAFYSYPEMLPMELIELQSVRSSSLGDTEAENENEDAYDESESETLDNSESEDTDETEDADAAEENMSETLAIYEDTDKKGPDSADNNGVIAQQRLKDNSPKVSVNEIRNVMYRMICAGKYYAATAYLKSCSEENSEVSLLYSQLAYAVGDPMGHCTYSSSNAFDLISRHDVLEDDLMVAMALRMFFSNQVRFDYSLKSFYNAIKGYSILNTYPALSKVLYALEEFKDAQKKGMDAYADYRMKSQTELDKEINSLREEAGSFYENFIVGRITERCSQKRFLETKTMMFSPNGDFGTYIKAILDNEFDLASLVEEFLQTQFYGQDAVIDENTYDDSLVWKYIMGFWEEAGKHMVSYKRHDDLKSRLRTNITNETVKVVQMLARWCSLVARKNVQADDDGTREYKKTRKGLLENLQEAIDRIGKDICSASENSEEKAGLLVLSHALEDLLNCINGTYDENTRKHFYIPFLLTEDITLGEDLLPDLDVHASALSSLQPHNRILSHFEKLADVNKDYSDRLKEILEANGDDYGSARIIVEYLSGVRADFDFSEVRSQIAAGEPFAHESADISKSDFIGELELAQSYGQIDNSVEDKKEMILQIVDDWYEWALDTSNFGFFKWVMQEYLSDIKQEAKTRERDLIEQLEKFKTETISGLSVEQKNTRIQRIQEMISEQNYTVAEDLLARAGIIEDENEEQNEEDFLKDFLDNYEDYYTPVAKLSTNFSALVSSRTRNKEERGAKRLADNWLPGGSALGQDKLKNLLTSFGFKIKTIHQQPSIGRFENYFVQTLGVENGSRIYYTHPIAAFGSGAAQDGFRVVCVNGGYDADGLIDIMKKIGDARHTLILLDAALTISERRRLARKTKNALGNKLFAVVDRTVMMFLVRNYDENKMNRMLVSLVAPFGFYQPYVWDSANVMPPEIFMGRKKELEDIKSPFGVNIVYGGRQLGKSALLKKAKDDIDNDENHDRAVYIEIKDKNYEEAARKIGHELYDQHILSDDIDTTDWDELARVLRRRLQSETEPNIPYLLLLLDEADEFIESCEAVNFKPFDALKEIQSIGSGRFKFVIAGLRNVVRFKREAALGNNSVLTHLQSMTVTPFNTSEARELLEIPLHYLGLRFPREKESLITLILATTNYFPGLIQLYCARLLEAMRSKDYAGYDEVNTPVYEVSEGHIKKVLADPAFTQQIREKFEITLKLGGDNYYYLIALIMAFLYHNNGYNTGYSADDIKKVGAEFCVSRIADLDEQKLVAFMEEMKELNVLRSTDENHYLFTRVSFFQMMGTSAEVDDKLEEYMEV